MTLKKCLFWSNRANSKIQATVQFGCLGGLAVGGETHQLKLNASGNALPKNSGCILSSRHAPRSHN
jgi:hypothetical protein